MFHASKKPARIGFLLLLGTLVLAPATRGEDEVKGLLKDLQGEWTFDIDGEGTWNFEKSKATVKLASGAVYVSTMSVDEKAQPNRVEFKIEEGPGDVVGQTVLGLIKREGQRVIVAVSHPGKERPTDFEPIDDQVIVFTMTKK